MEDKKIFSEEQERAIKTRDRTLLVSAAAGSGKTTTLTERIIRSLLDKDNPESIRNMLIVTFTNASVFDLREKISAALSKAVNENPENKRLENELYSLESAKIMTIDSFCAELVRINAERLGITPTFRVADGAEALLLERALLSALTEAAYASELMPEVEPAAFEKLCDALTGVKNTATLSDKLISLYEKTKSMVKGVDIFADFANDYLQYSTKPIEESPYGKYAMDMARSTFEYLPRLLNHYAEPLFASNDKALIAFGEQLSEIANRFSSLGAAAADYSQMREKIFAFELPKAVTIKNPKPKEALAAIDYRQSFKDSLTKLKSTFFSHTAEEWAELYRDMSSYVSTLASFLKGFSALYFEEKKKRGCFEFSDIERLAYDCLWENGELTDIAKSYRELFSSVYIDEYQDVNELQNKIFEAVSPPRSRFMVGDIKQSIYGFRSARPEIFSDMKRSFPLLSDVYAPESSIFMSNNYRCDKGIIDFVNEVFDKLFGAVKDSIGYVKEDRLEYKKSYKDFTPEYEKAKICLVKKSEPDGETEEDEFPDAEFIAKTAEELIKHGKRRDGSPICASDIAILCRTKKNFSVYKEALEMRGIKASAPEDKDFFMNKEILLTLSLLNSIDNPRKDIHLASLMCSPLYDFTADEIYVFKAEGGEITLYDSLKKYAEANPDCKKLTGFLGDLSHYRILSEGMNIDLLLTRLYHETGLLSLASKQGGVENLHKLYSYARKFESSSYKGLYNFISYVNNLIEKGATIDKNEAAEEENSVHIGTIHSSKGLEFPVVFLADAASPIVNLDTREKIAFSESFGISFLLRGPLGLALVENPLHHIILDYMNKKFFEEIIRLLYVALTRAKEKLYVVGLLDSDEDENEYLESMRLLGNALSSFSVRELKTYLDMICATAQNADFIFADTKEDGECKTAVISEPSEEKAEAKERKTDTLTQEILSRFSFAYPNEHLTALPEKMSVSRLYPTVLDGIDYDSDLMFSGEEISKSPIPEPTFISGSDSRRSAKRGIATHYFLQFFDIENLRKSGVIAELSRLSEKGFISEKNKELVRINELIAFEKSELLSAMENAKNLYREFRFNTRLPAELFTEDEEKKKLYEGKYVLVQGVIDCLIENADGSLRLVDYKTDRLSEAELCDEALAARKLSEKHSLQLSYYARAVEKIFGKAPASVEVYSLPLGKTVSVK